MDLGTVVNGGDFEGDDGGHEVDTSGDLTGLEGGKGKQGKGQYNGYCYQRGPVGTHGKELRVNSNNVLQLWSVGTHGKVVS